MLFAMVFAWVFVSFVVLWPVWLFLAMFGGEMLRYAWRLLFGAYPLHKRVKHRLHMQYFRARMKWGSWTFHIRTSGWYVDLRFKLSPRRIVWRMQRMTPPKYRCRVWGHDWYDGLCGGEVCGRFHCREVRGGAEYETAF